MKTSPFVSLTKIPENDKWLCRFINSPSFFKINDLTAGAIVLGAEKEWDYDELMGKIHHISGLSYEKIKSLISYLLDKNVMLQETDESDYKLLNKFRTYQKYGWKSSAEYHFSSIDYPFIDYHTLSGFQKDSDMMQSFFSREEEIPRYKSYLSHSFIPCPRPSEISFDRKHHNTIHLHDIQDIVCFSLGRVRDGKSVKKNGEPLIHKVVPSGGGRHPTEAYLIAIDIDDLNNGVYHFDWGLNRLDKLEAEVSPEQITEIFYPPESYLGFSPRAIVVLTSVFERNMFRYREPRTFRAVHMDVGHILKVMETISNIKDLNSQIQYHTCESLLEELLKLEPFHEGVMASFAIG